jgi:DNA-binding CsgD family transcriptional regulator
MRNALAAERYGWRLALPSVHAMLADVLIETGDAEAAWRHIERGEQAAEHEPSPGRTALLAARGRLNLVGGEPERALPDLLACGERLMGAGVVNPAVLPWRADAARAHALLGRTDEAFELAVEELELAERAGAPGGIGSALRTLGGVTPGEEGLDLLRRAVERLQDSQVALERARALVDYGAALSRRRKRRAAREPLHHGLDLALRCGAAELVERARGELGAAGARPRRTAVHGVEALTARERQVAALAAEGKSNREIAHTLYVTVKTVEWHLKHAYKKLDVSSRAELRGALGPES